MEFLHVSKFVVVFVFQKSHPEQHVIYESSTRLPILTLTLEYMMKFRIFETFPNTLKTCYIRILTF